MKTSRYLLLLLALAAGLSACTSTSGRYGKLDEPAPLVAINGPIDLYRAKSGSSTQRIFNEVAPGSTETSLLSIKAPSLVVGTTLNLTVRAYFCKVNTTFGGGYSLQQLVEVSSDYFASFTNSFYSGKSYAISSSTNNKAEVYFKLNNAPFQTAHRGDCLLMFIAKSGDHQIAYLYSIDSPYSP